ncbi:MAG: TIGR04326 family surface carbohydrate biosynthesis protein, partial [Bilophila wadsworthia]
MATLILLNKTELPKGTPSEALVAVWDKGSVPDGQISIPVELNERLLPIRDDLAAWTYETGCARINGKLLEEHLRADDNLSMWWCSTLVEKHPKVTHNLFPALKLRALELLLDEKGVTRLELCAAAGADPWMEDVLGRFCKATGREFAVRRIGSAEAAQPEGLKAKLKACYYRLPAPVKALVRFPAWLWIVRRRLPRTPLSRPALPEGVKPASIVTYFPNIDMAAAKNGRFRSRYWEKLHDALQPADGKPNRVNWVFLYFPAPQCSFPDAIKLRDRFRANGQDGASFHFLEEFLTNGDIAKSLVRFGKLLLSSRAVEPQVRELFRFPGSQMDLWPVLKDNWGDSTRGWRALERCLMREAFRRYAEWAGPQEWTTFRRKTARGNVCSASPCTTGTPGRSTRAALHGAPHGLPLFRRSPHDQRSCLPPGHARTVAVQRDRRAGCPACRAHAGGPHRAGGSPAVSLSRAQARCRSRSGDARQAHAAAHRHQLLRRRNRRPPRHAGGLRQGRDAGRLGSRRQAASLPARSRTPQEPVRRRRAAQRRGWPHR